MVVINWHMYSCLINVAGRERVLVRKCFLLDTNVRCFG